jgi:hypothetical protein
MSPIGRWVKDIEYPIEHDEVIHCFVWRINTPCHYKDTGILPNSVAGEEGNRSGISP